MKTYKTLVKLSKREMDIKRRELNVFLDKKDKLLSHRKRLAEQLLQEQKFASDSTDMNFTYANYVAHINNQQENINNVTGQLDEKIDMISDEIAERFAEMKKYEIMIDRKEKEQEKKLLKKEQLELDEIALSSFLRKQDF